MFFLNKFDNILDKVGDWTLTRASVAMITVTKTYYLPVLSRFCNYLEKKTYYYAQIVSQCHFSLLMYCLFYQTFNFCLNVISLLIHMFFQKQFLFPFKSCQTSRLIMVFVSLCL